MGKHIGRVVKLGHPAYGQYGLITKEFGPAVTVVSSHGLELTYEMTFIKGLQVIGKVRGDSNRARIDAFYKRYGDLKNDKKEQSCQTSTGQC